MATETYLRQELARLREVRKQETEDRQRQHEEVLAAAREDAARQLKAKDVMVQRLNEESAQMRVDHDRALREKEAIEVRWRQQKGALESERKLVSAECRQLKERIQVERRRLGAANKSKSAP